MQVYQCFGGGILGKASAAADTVYYAVVPGDPRGFTRIGGFQYNCGNTANNFTFLRPIGRTTVAVAATSGSTLTLTADPSPSGNTIAAGDQVVIKYADGTYRRSQVSAWNGTTKVVTLTANIAANIDALAKFWMFGVAADTDPTTGLAFPVYTPTVNTVANVEFYGGGVVGGQAGDPLLIYNPNATAATTLNHAGYGYTIQA